MTAIEAYFVIVSVIVGAGTFASVLSWRWSRNCRAWGLGTRSHVRRADSENRTLVSCGGGLESYCVDGGGGCRYVGIEVSLVWVMVSRISLRTLFVLILVGFILPDFLVSCLFHFAYSLLRSAKIICGCGNTLVKLGDKVI